MHQTDKEEVEAQSGAVIHPRLCQKKELGPEHKPHATDSRARLLILRHEAFEMVDTNSDVKVLACLIGNSFYLFI